MIHAPAEVITGVSLGDGFSSSPDPADQVAYRIRDRDPKLRASAQELLNYLEANVAPRVMWSFSKLGPSSGITIGGLRSNHSNDPDAWYIPIFLSVEELRVLFSTQSTLAERSIARFAAAMTVCGAAPIFPRVLAHALFLQMLHELMVGLVFRTCRTPFYSLTSQASMQ